MGLKILVNLIDVIVKIQIFFCSFLCVHYCDNGSRLPACTVHLAGHGSCSHIVRCESFFLSVRVSGNTNADPPSRMRVLLAHSLHTTYNTAA